MGRVYEMYMYIYVLILDVLIRGQEHIMRYWVSPLQDVPIRGHQEDRYPLQDVLIRGVKNTL